MTEGLNNLPPDRDPYILTSPSPQRHTLRGWSKHFTTLHTSELCLYKTYNDYVERREKPEEGPVDISNCLVSIEYRLKKPVFRLVCQNGKEYLFKVLKSVIWSGYLQCTLYMTNSDWSLILFVKFVKTFILIMQSCVCLLFCDISKFSNVCPCRLTLTRTC